MLIREFLRLSFLAILLIASSAGPCAQSLREQADKSGLLVGAAVDPARLRLAGTHHGDGCRPAARRERRAIGPGRPRAASGHLPICCNCMCARAGLHCFHDVGIHGQAQLDSRLYKRGEGKGVAFRSGLRAETSLQRLARSAGAHSN